MSRSALDLQIIMASQEEVGQKAMPDKKEVEIPECPVHSVVVYPDRAEVGGAEVCYR